MKLRMSSQTENCWMYNGDNDDGDDNDGDDDDNGSDDND